MRRAFRQVAVMATGVLVAAVPALVAAAPAQASGGAGVSQTPAAFTPFLTSANSEVDQIVQCGGTMYAVGTFTQVGVPSGTKYTRNRAFSFSATTGALTSWNPSVNGAVEGIALSSNCATAYLAGTFTAVHGTAVTNLAAVSTSTSAVVTAFRPQPNKTAFTLVLHGAQLIVGGSFTSIGGAARTALASVSPTTGAITSFTNLGISGVLPGDSGLTRVYKLRASPNGSRLLTMGNFTKVAGQTRQQAFITDLGTSSSTLDAWYSPVLSQACAAKQPYYVRAGTWSPDASRVYFATTGDVGPSPLCDSASAFSSSSSGSLSPIWTNKTGCDSLFSVAADTSAVYVAGHQRWANNEKACDKAGAGSVSRPGISAMSVSSGRAVAWNPTRARGHGAHDQLRTTAGLWISSDDYLGATQCGGVYHPGICFFPNG
jgi:hypothetical protein